MIFQKKKTSMVVRITNPTEGRRGFFPFVPRTKYVAQPGDFIKCGRSSFYFSLKMFVFSLDPLGLSLPICAFSVSPEVQGSGFSPF